MMEKMGAGPSNSPPKEKSIYDMSYNEFLREKKIFRESTRKAGEEAILTFSDDYKRIQIQQFVDIANYEDVGRLTPEQAIGALWELVHHQAYQKVIDEFEGLREQVDRKYKEMMDKRIKVVWKP
jgi:hypothetical protein